MVMHWSQQYGNDFVQHSVDKARLYKHENQNTDKYVKAFMDLLWLKQIIFSNFVNIMISFSLNASFYLCSLASNCIRVTEGNEQKRKRVKTESDISRLTPSMRNHLENCANLKGEQVCICAEV